MAESSSDGSSVHTTLKHGTPTDDELEELGILIVDEWKKLGRRLCVDHSKLQEIDLAHVQPSEKGYQMLRHWKQKNGRTAATYKVLCDALKHQFVQRQDLAERFCYVDGTHDAGASGKDEEDSSGVRSDLKRKRLDLNSERGNLSWKIHCASATSRNSGKQDPQEEKEKVNRLMLEKIDEAKGSFDFSTSAGIGQFYKYLLREHQLINVNFERGSIKVTVKCCTLEILEHLWDDYCSGHLNAVAEECLITEKVKDELGMETIKLTTTILKEDYLACRLSLMEISGKGPVCSILVPSQQK